MFGKELIKNCCVANNRCLQSAILLASLVLTGCGSGSVESDSTEMETQPVDTPNPPPSAPTPPQGQVRVSQDARYAVEPTYDVQYAEGLSHAGWLSESVELKPLLLDVYQPAGLEGKKPAIVMVHGGGFIVGHKGDGNIVDVIEYMVQRGFVGFSIGYRLIGDYGTLPREWNNFANELYNSGRATEFQLNKTKAIYPAVRDVKAALRWIVSNADSLNVDTNFITLGGGSAGAISALAAANTETGDYKDELTVFDDPTLAMTHTDVDYQVHTIVDYWGGTRATDLPSIVFQGQSRWDASDVPVCIIHGTEDTTVLFSEALEIDSHYLNSGVDYQLFPLQGEGHSAWSSKYNGKSMGELAFDCAVNFQPLEVVN